MERPRWSLPLLALLVACGAAAGVVVAAEDGTVADREATLTSGGMAGQEATLTPSPDGSATPTPGGSTACTGRVTEPATGTTVVSIQGGRAGEKRQARLVAFGPNGSVQWVRPSGEGIVWSYDVDPLPDGNLFVTATVPGDTLVYELDPRTGTRVWSERFDATDTHDADLIEGGEEILVANMRNYRDGDNEDRVFIYNRTTDEVVWEWQFAEHGFPRSGGGDYREDWTHVNDVDYLPGDRVLVSPRNFDQVLVIDRETKEVELRLGSDGDHGTLFEQHNPDYLESRDGDPTLLVADSENDRIVEYERVAGTEGTGTDDWERTWTLTGDLDWPRDADRLPDGNTLVVDSRNHRVLEVAPDGEVVWEVYTPWLPYDAERVRAGDGSRGPTIEDQGATGRVEARGAGGAPAPSTLESCAGTLSTLDRDTATPYPPGGGPGTVAMTWTPTATPSATPTATATPLAPALALAALTVAAALLWARRRR